MKFLLRTLAIAIGLAAFFALGFALRDIQNGRPVSRRALDSLFGRPAPRPTVAPTRVFADALNKIQADYYKPVETEKLRYAGVAGLVASLGDPHTMFMEPKMAQEFALETTGNFVGVGARLSPDPLGAKAVVVFEDGPAYASGLRPGDIITAVDGKTVVGSSTDEIVKRIRGEEGTPVRLTVVRASSAANLEIRIVRRPITVPSVESRVLEGTRVGYIAVTSFSEPTVQQFTAALDRLDLAAVEGLVIDLRGNPGGLLNTASDMLSEFVAGKTVVTMKMREGNQEVEKTRTGRLRKKAYPLALLLDESSASAAEIFAGVLRDYGLATLVGTHSYGKASVQNVFPLRDESSLKVTIARYYLPKGEDIGRKVDPDGQYLSGGLKPDFEVELDMEKSPILGDLKSDNQLQKAVEVVQKRTQA
ncbi:MAG: S41 family peptidase [Fimbriimonadaceae bacterium]|nr:S41 family peptidase [Fimbriimonadaceae bacterium]